ncbi:MAG: tRNA (N(6)-L-threonylcarbamoyladenosine(37)-C(2))-methylthiotransferase [Candidatus Lokiarchaeota archaeon]|nr:tRNA (N(6)-L-threonylcarbamoyladenosine(37)-C(2))-methylthiotransferase [Candidatus Lokiarchaeota archaeon]
MEERLINHYFFIETYGCASNKADSNIMINLLLNSGYIRTNNFEEAKYIIINTCAVKEQTENKIRARLKHYSEYQNKNSNKKIIIAGCLPHISDEYINIIKNIIPNYSAIVDMNSIINIVNIIRDIDLGIENLLFKSEKKIDKSKFPLLDSINKITGIIPISEGCLGSCTYCCVKNARGKLKCNDPTNILDNISSHLDKNIKQIYLTSQDCSIYHYNETNLMDLVKRIHNINKDFFLRIGMINPGFFINNFEQLLEIFKLNKVYQFLHIPLQSGSNNILKKMGRTYLISDIIKKIDILREKFNYLTISTDIICGFPGESEYDFYRTVNIVKWLKPEIINISKFTPRPNTKAKMMTQLDSKIIKDRTLRLSKLFRRSLDTINQKWIDWEGKVLLLHKGSEENQAFGRNFAYKNIFIEDYSGDYNEFIKVKIDRVEGFNLFGKII